MDITTLADKVATKAQDLSGKVEAIKDRAEGLAQKAETLTDTLADRAETLSDKAAVLSQRAETIVARAGALAEEISTQSGPLPAPKLAPKAQRGYDALIDALNRLPRPMIALTTLGLFVLAAINPAWFEARMEALSSVPEPLWWLAGAVITLFFGSREAHYRRQTPAQKAAADREASKTP